MDLRSFLWYLFLTAALSFKKGFSTRTLSEFGREPLLLVLKFQLNPAQSGLLPGSGPSGSYRDVDRFALHALLCKLQSSVRKCLDIASQRRHIHRFRPAVGHTVVQLAAAGHSREPSAALLDSTRLSASHRVATRLRVHGQPFLLHRCGGPLLERVVGGMDEVRLSRRANVRAKKNPRVGALYQVRAAFDIRIHSQKVEFVTAQRDEEAIARRLTGSHNPNRFQPTRQSAPLLARALPPGAARCHENERRQRRVAARYFDGDVEGLCGRPAYLSNKRRFRAALGLLVQPVAFCARDLQHGWAERFAESRSVHQEKSRPGATRQNDHRLMLAAPRLRDLAPLLVPRFCELGRFRFCQPNFGIAAERAEPSMYPFSVGKVGVERRHAIDAATSDSQVARLRIDPIKGEGFKRRLCAQLPHLVGQPLGRCFVHLRPRAVVALGVITLNHIRDALLKRIWCDLRLLLPKKQARTSRAGR